MPTVAELKAQLKALGLPALGPKAVLEGRLQEALAGRPTGGGGVEEERTAKRLAVEEGAGMAPVVVPPRSPPKSKAERMARAMELFDCFAGGSSSLEMTPTETFAMCEQLGVDPEDQAIMVLSHRLGSEHMGYFKRDDFVKGLDYLNAFSLDAIVAALPRLQAQTRWGQPGFDTVYAWCYGWACEPGQKIVQRDVALGLWKLLLPKSAFGLIDKWLAFCEAEKIVVSRDLWTSLLRWVRLINQVGGIDKFQQDPNSSWPVAIDDFVSSIKGADTG